MTWWQWLCVGFVILLSFLAFFEKKIWIPQIIKDQISIFYKYDESKRKKKLYWLDLCIFFGLPITLASSLTWGFGITLTDTVAQVLISVFSVIFTILFGLSSFMASTNPSGDKTEKQVSSETFTTIVTSVLLSLLAVILLTIYLFFDLPTACPALIRIFSFAVFLNSFFEILLIRVIVKRCYLIFQSRK